MEKKMKNKNKNNKIKYMKEIIYSSLSEDIKKSLKEEINNLNCYVKKLFFNCITKKVFQKKEEQE
jgi:hypothetical protein